MSKLTLDDVLDIYDNPKFTKKEKLETFYQIYGKKSKETLLLKSVFTAMGTALPKISSSPKKKPVSRKRKR